MPLELREVVARLDAEQLPVLRRTATGVAAASGREEGIAAADLAAGVLHDPLMTLKVLRYVNGTHHKHFDTGIASIGQALMMLGIGRFFRHFSALRTVEEHLRAAPHALAHVLRLVNQAWHAACHARDWATCRKDARIEEVQIAALLHDMGEMVLAVCIPKAIPALEQAAPGSWRSQPEVQRAVLGFTVVELQDALAAAWELPELLKQLLHPAHTDNPRVQTVLLAHRVAHRLGQGVPVEELREETAQVAELLRFHPEEVASSILHNENVARSAPWAGIAAGA